VHSDVDGAFLAGAMWLVAFGNGPHRPSPVSSLATTATAIDAGLVDVLLAILAVVGDENAIRLVHTEDVLSPVSGTGTTTEEIPYAATTDGCDPNWGGWYYAGTGPHVAGRLRS
jgi:hypothetical protein